MATYHYTDQLGQAVTGAKKAALEAADQLAALDEELAAERESHRAETLRLVERAEAAELEAIEERDARRDAEDQRDDAERAQRLAEDRVAELESELEEATSARDTAEERVSDLEERVADLMEDADDGAPMPEEETETGHKLTELEDAVRAAVNTLTSNHTLTEYQRRLERLRELVD